MLLEMDIGLQIITLFLSDFTDTWVFWADFRKILSYQISRKSVHVDRHTWRR